MPWQTLQGATCTPQQTDRFVRACEDKPGFLAICDGRASVVSKLGCFSSVMVAAGINYGAVGCIEIDAVESRSAGFHFRCTFLSPIRMAKFKSWAGGVQPASRSTHTQPPFCHVSFRFRTLPVAPSSPGCRVHILKPELSPGSTSQT